ncbi:MAG TPA: thiosulfate oxidation carrier protein SoxY [Burkholderiales bacterium]|nr:thiosulfate oxidation carrier protein SoxY [Burkholderiales bacterium]
MRRRHFLAGMGAAALLPQRALGQTAAIDELVRAATRGAPARKGRVKLELPVLADNGNSVAMKVSITSPMSAADHVKSIRLLSERNPVRDMATFHLGPRAGRAEIASRVRLAGSQNVVAVAEMSDGSFWFDVANVIVTLSACLDES